MERTGEPHRRPAPPSSSSPFPPLASPYLPLPSALMPPKKRKVTTPIPPPPPLPAPLVSPEAGAGASADAPHPTPPPPADVAASSPPARESVPMIAEIPSPPPPRPAADGKPSMPPPRRRPAAAKRRARRNSRSYIGLFVPVPAAAGENSSAAAVEASHPGEDCAAKEKLAGDQNAGSDKGLGKNQDFVETAEEKVDSSLGAVAASACEEVLLDEKAAARGGTLASEPEDCDASEEGKKLLSNGEEDGSVVGVSDWKREVFVGRLDRDAKEADVRAALSGAGEITEVRMVLDVRENRNKGYCFVSFREAAQARKAVEEFGRVKICQSTCRVAALEMSGRIFLGNINKKWKEEDIMKLLEKIGVENINTLVLKADSNRLGYNRGFAHLELETARDAQIAFEKLSTRKGVFGKWRNITVEWAAPSYGPVEKEMQVKSVFVQGIPNSWARRKLRKVFKKYGKVEHVVLSCDMRSAISADSAFIHYTTREAAILCVESFNDQELIDNESKVNIKVSLAKPPRNGSLNKDHKFASYRTQDNLATHSREKRCFAALGYDSSHYVSYDPHAQYDSTYATSTSSYGVPAQSIAEYYPLYHLGNGRYLQDFNYGVAVAETRRGSPIRQPDYYEPRQLLRHRCYRNIDCS